MVGAENLARLLEVLDPEHPLYDYALALLERLDHDLYHSLAGEFGATPTADEVTADACDRLRRRDHPVFEEL